MSAASSVAVPLQQRVRTALEETEISGDKGIRSRRPANEIGRIDYAAEIDDVAPGTGDEIGHSIGHHRHGVDELQTIGIAARSAGDRVRAKNVARVVIGDGVEAIVAVAAVERIAAFP